MKINNVKYNKHTGEEIRSNWKDCLAALICGSVFALIIFEGLKGLK